MEQSKGIEIRYRDLAEARERGESWNEIHSRYDVGRSALFRVWRDKADHTVQPPRRRRKPMPPRTTPAKARKPARRPAHDAVPLAAVNEALALQTPLDVATEIAAAFVARLRAAGVARVTVDLVAGSVRVDTTETFPLPGWQ